MESDHKDTCYVNTVNAKCTVLTLPEYESRFADKPSVEEEGEVDEKEEKEESAAKRPKSENDPSVQVGTLKIVFGSSLFGTISCSAC